MIIPVLNDPKRPFANYYLAYYYNLIHFMSNYNFIKIISCQTNQKEIWRTRKLA